MKKLIPLILTLGLLLSLSACVGNTSEDSSDPVSGNSSSSNLSSQEESSEPTSSEADSSEEVSSEEVSSKEQVSSEAPASSKEEPSSAPVSSEKAPEVSSAPSEPEEPQQIELALSDATLTLEAGQTTQVLLESNISGVQYNAQAENGIGIQLDGNVLTVRITEQSSSGKITLTASKTDCLSATVVIHVAVEEPSSQPEEQVSLSADQQSILDSVNAERAAMGLSSLRVSSELTGYAQTRAQECDALEKSGQEYGHYRPDGSSWSTVIPGYYSWAGENLSRSEGAWADDIMAAWMDSPGHRANILSSEAEEIGIGIYTSDTGITYWTQLFRKP